MSLMLNNLLSKTAFQENVVKCLKTYDFKLMKPLCQTNILRLAQKYQKLRIGIYLLYGYGEEMNLDFCNSFMEYDNYFMSEFYNKFINNILI